MGQETFHSVASVKEVRESLGNTYHVDSNGILTVRIIQTPQSFIGDPDWLLPNYDTAGKWGAGYALDRFSRNGVLLPVHSYGPWLEIQADCSRGTGNLAAYCSEDITEVSSEVCPDGYDQVSYDKCCSNVECLFSDGSITSPPPTSSPTASPTLAPTFTPSKAPTPTPDPFSMAFTSLNSGDNYEVGDMIDMSVELSGDLSDANEIQYLTRKDDGDFVVQATQSLTGLSSYEYSWSPTESGTYALRITATKNGSYITHVVVGGINVEETQTLDPFSMAFTSLRSGGNYEVGDMIDMSVELSGDLSDADEIQYLTRKDDGDFVVQATQSLTGLSSYEYSWSPTESGTYSLRITATKNGSYVTHVVVGDIAVEEAPLKLEYKVLLSGSTYQIG